MQFSANPGVGNPGVVCISTFEAILQLIRQSVLKDIKHQHVELKKIVKVGSCFLHVGDSAREKNEQEQS